MEENKGLLIVSYTFHKTKSLLFFVVQTEHGDLFKVTLDVGKSSEKNAPADDVVLDVRMLYFDTIPTAVSLCILKTGFLFSASEFGNHYLFQIAAVGTPAQSSRLFSSSGFPVLVDLVTSLLLLVHFPGQQGDVESKRENGGTFMYFQPRSLRNLELIDEMDSLSPITDMKVADLTRELTPQIYTVCSSCFCSSARHSTVDCSQSVACCCAAMWSGCSLLVTHSSTWSRCNSAGQNRASRYTCGCLGPQDTRCRYA